MSVFSLLKKGKENHDPPNSMTIMGSNNNIYNGQSGDGSDHHLQCSPLFEKGKETTWLGDHVKVMCYHARCKGSEQRMPILH